MNKKGFTLAEVLIALGIISLMASLMIPAFNHAKPDKTKMLYLKAYDSLVTVVKQLGNEPTLFNPLTGIGQNIYNLENYPFLDPTTPLNSSFRTCNAPKLKFACILSKMLNGYNETSGSSSLSFYTMPGNFKWTVTPIGDPLIDSSTAVRLANKIDLDIDNNSFSFCVYADGMINVLDSKGATYIKYRKNVRSKHDSQTVTPTVTSCASKTYKVVTTTHPDYYEVTEE